MMYTLSLYNVVCQLYLNETGTNCFTLGVCTYQISSLDCKPMFPLLKADASLGRYNGPRNGKYKTA